MDTSDYQGDKYDFAAPDSSSSNYKHWDLSTNAPIDEVRLDFAVGVDHTVSGLEVSRAYVGCCCAHCSSKCRCLTSCTQRWLRRNGWKA
eukprot:COSAG02_NODE_453_length_22025_cov_16.179923_5_plen_89_part_00